MQVYEYKKTETVGKHYHNNLRARKIDRQTDERERGDEVFFFLISHSTDYLY